MLQRSWAVQDSNYLLVFFACLPKNAAIIFIAHFLLTKYYQAHNEKTDKLLGDIPLQEK